MRSKLKWGDFVIVGLVLLLAGAVSVGLAQSVTGEQLYAEVSQDGVLLERIALTERTERTLDLDGHNTIVLDGKTAQMTASDCRDQVCVHTGVLTRAGQAAVCLPNRVVVRLVGGAQAQIDAIA